MNQTKGPRQIHRQNIQKSAKHRKNIIDKWDTVKRSNIGVTGVPYKNEGKKTRPNQYLKLTQNFLQQVNNIDPQILDMVKSLN